MRTLAVALALALVLVASQAFAVAGPTVYGLKGGLTIANLSGDDVEDTDSRIVGCFGGFVEIPITNMISFQPEVLYAMKGAKWSEGDDEGTYKLTYVEIPALLKLNVPTSGGMRPFLVVGPGVAFKVSATEEGTFEGEDYDEDMDDVAGTDIGLIVGGGVGFPLAGRAASLEARYDLGLTTIYDSDEEDAEECDVKNTAISLLLGIAF